MSLTHAQKLSLRTHILANQTQLAFENGTATIASVFGNVEGLNGGDAQLIAEHYNEATTHHVYRTSVSQQEVMLNGFDWTRVDNLSVGKARIWEWLFFDGSIDPSKTNIRAGINATWVGTAPDLAVRAAVYAHCSRVANRAELAIATADGTQGAGTAPAQDGSGPGVAAFQGTLDGQAVSDIYGIPV